jgi:hypothetical protein
MIHGSWPGRKNALCAGQERVLDAKGNHVLHIPGDSFTQAAIIPTIPHHLESAAERQITHEVKSIGH